MTWVRVEEAAPTNGKFLLAGLEAFGWWVSALAYCNRELKDGFVSARAVPIVFAGVSPERAMELVEALVREGLLHPVKAGERPRCSHRRTCPRFTVRDTGWILHDFNEFQPRKKVVLERRRQKSIAGRKGGETKAKRYQHYAKQDAKHSATAPLCPRPDPTRPEIQKKTTRAREKDSGPEPLCPHVKSGEPVCGACEQEIEQQRAALKAKLGVVIPKPTDTQRPREKEAGHKAQC